MRINNTISTIIIALIAFSCSQSVKNELFFIKKSKNQFPITYEGLKVLEYNFPYTPPQGGGPLLKDTFAIYSLINQSHQTLWVVTIPLVESCDLKKFYFKDKTIKKIFMRDFCMHSFDRHKWECMIESNGCGFGSNDSVKLMPEEKLFFIDKKKSTSYPYDSVSFKIKIKYLIHNKIKDSLITKKQIRINNILVEDTSKWYHHHY